MNLSKKNNPYWFILFASLFFIAFFVIENLNDRFWLNDFKVYYSAAQAFLHGEKVYGVPFGLDTGYYKYSPFVLLLFTPDCLLPYEAAAVVHFFALAGSAVACIIIINKIIVSYIFKTTTEKGNLLMSISLLCIAVHLVRELHLGNVNIIILLLISFSVLLILEEKYFLPGILIAIAVLLKPYFLLLLIPLLALRKWKVLSSFGISLLASAILCSLIFGFSRYIELNKEWFNSMAAHGSYLQSNNNVRSLLNIYFKISLPGWGNVAITGTAAVLLMALLNIKLQYKKPNHQTLLITGIFTAAALIPNLVITDTEHFLLSLPLVMILLRYVMVMQNKFLTAGFVILIFFFGGNSTDLLGKNLSAGFDSLGLLGISNILLICSVLYLLLSGKKSILKTQV
jgi:hypothetical protein